MTFVVVVCLWSGCVERGVLPAEIGHESGQAGAEFERPRSVRVRRGAARGAGCAREGARVSDVSRQQSDTQCPLHQLRQTQDRLHLQGTATTTATATAAATAAATPGQTTSFPGQPG